MDNSTNTSGATANWRLKLAAGGITILATLVALELLAWSVFTYQSDIKNALRATGFFGSAHLDPYEITDTETPGHWRLRPGFTATNSDLIKSKQATGKWLGAEALATTDAANSTNGMRINSNGFKGAEIDTLHRCPRVLMIGDSVTFGLGGASYPNFTKQKLSNSGVGVEIINAGVEGYSVANLLIESPRYLALKPEIVTIYIGWNSVFAAGLNELTEEELIKTPWLISQISRVLREKLEGHKLLQRDEIIPDRSSKLVDDVLDLSPSQLHKISKIIDDFVVRDTKVFVVTLFGLFHLDQEPSPKALRMGHLPENVINPYVLAALSERYNRGLKELIKGTDVELIDLESWGRQNLIPPEKYFTDSVHLNVLGLEKMGAFFASELRPSILSLDKACGPNSMN